MNGFAKFALAATLTGAVALAAATPGEARNGRNTAAAIGFGAGALVGAAVASSANNSYYAGPGYYDRGYYAYEPAPTYTYEPGYYAYEPAPMYRTAPRYYNRGNVATDNSRCGGNPATPGYTPCANQ